MLGLCACPVCLRTCLQTPTNPFGAKLRPAAGVEAHPVPVPAYARTHTTSSAKPVGAPAGSVAAAAAKFEKVAVTAAPEVCCVVCKEPVWAFVVSCLFR